MDDPYTRVPNWLLDTLTDYTPAQVLVLLVIARSTMGYHREEAEISLSQFAARTGLARRTIPTVLRQLHARGVICRTPAGVNTWRLTRPASDLRSLEVVISDHQTSDLRSPEVVISDHQTSDLRSLEVVISDHQTSDLRSLPEPGFGASARAETPPERKDLKKDLKKERGRARAAPLQQVFDPAVEIYRQTCGVKPNRQQCEVIAASVTECDAWQAVCDEWMLRGWNAKNVPNLLDAYRQRTGGARDSPAAPLPLHARPVDPPVATERRLTRAEQAVIVRERLHAD